LSLVNYSFGDSWKVADNTLNTTTLKLNMSLQHMLIPKARMSN